MLKDLIRTERRSIDLEEQLARTHARDARAERPRPAAILLVEHDRDVADDLAERLEAAGVTTLAYITGEDAVREADQTLAAGSCRLSTSRWSRRSCPDIDGLETIRRLRDQAPGLPGVPDDLGPRRRPRRRAADLGVVGFVQKPLADVDDGRAARAARRESLSRTREHTYLERIKERHERVLARYRSLPREQPMELRPMISRISSWPRLRSASSCAAPRGSSWRRSTGAI